ncbi:apolipoprotein N-acyltransferase [Actinocorallia sp. A-T 12471]|uniref:apolipoprotein N-acyltransferase n=1 Tax=Actinocorallia sp. A-T 12471 TaxID=3089813 RepID=UPI0029D001AB|nr:apolipoprotein N-acyltransferase [Actinocorallia sp. A-T 12471]MDX6741212.1 apolipoprotein N-acyltransferase [Actinocorallia sp. A-T 12471]
MTQETVTAEPETAPRAEAAGSRGGRATRVAVSAAAGLIMFLAFPPNVFGPDEGSPSGLWPLAPVGVAVLALALRGLRPWAGALAGLVCGLFFFIPILPGLRPIGTDVWLGLSVVQALYFAPMGAAMAYVSRSRLWPLWVAGLWVAQELVRGRAPLGGFPWARLAFAQTDTPFTAFAALGGAPLVSFATALSGTLLAFAVLAVAARGLKAAALAVAGALAVPLAGLAVPTGAGTGGESAVVAVIQGNVPRSGMDFLGQRQAVLNNHIARTRELAAQVRSGEVPQPDLVVWPENASDIDPYNDPEARRLIDAVVKEVGAPVLVGALTSTPDGTMVENRGIVWDPQDGPGEHYTKRHPVPFGEYIPFRDVLTKIISRLERVPRDFARGTEDNTVMMDGVPVGDVICFEVAYDGIVRDAAEARILVVQTNNATYGRTSLPWQQLAMSRLRAVEHDRTVLVAATSGISAIVAPDGTLVDKSREFTPDVQVARVPLRASVTISDRLGGLPEWLLALVGVTGVGLALTARRRASHPGPGEAA